MRADIEAREPERDPELAAALRQTQDDIELSQADFQRLRLRIRAGAQSLDRGDDPAPRVRNVPGAPRRRFPRPVLALPALLAAALAGILLFRAQDRPPATPATVQVAAGSTTAEQALQADVSDAEFARLVSGADDAAALLRIAVSGGSVPAR